MRSGIIIILLAISTSIWSQEVFHYPDDVYSSYIGLEFNYSNNNLHIVIVDSGAYYSFDHNSTDQIWHSLPETNKSIKRIKKILTYQFVKELVDCCEIKGCPDARVEGGCYIAAQEGRQFESISIDKTFLAYDKCGNEELEEIIECYLKIKETTANTR